MKFGMFFLGEYLGITLISAVITALFFWGWMGPWLPPLAWFILKTLLGIVFLSCFVHRFPCPDTTGFWHGAGN